MLIRFFYEVRRAGIPASTSELLDLLRSLASGVGLSDLEEFYLLSRSCLVKNEKFYALFDAVFAGLVDDVDYLSELLKQDIPESWLENDFFKQLTDEEKAELEALSRNELTERLRELLARQNERHEGGGTWIGSGGTSPFGRAGFNPRGIRFGSDGRHGNALFTVDPGSSFAALAGNQQVGARNMQVAISRLREFAKEKVPEELDVDATIDATARNAGVLDIQMRPERQNIVSVLLLLDTGGSMTKWAEIAETLFTAMRSEFKNLEVFYFRNIMRHDVRTEDGSRVLIEQLVRTYGKHFKVFIVGDAAMAPWELAEGYLDELLRHFDQAVWLNPEPENEWHYTKTIGTVRTMMGGNMYPLTPDGLTDATKRLTR